MTNSLTVNSNTYTDDSDPSTGLANGGHRARLLPMLSDTIVEISNRVGNVAGIGTSFRYSFSTTTTDADPGAGVMRLNAGTQNTATKIWLDDTDAAGGSVGSVIDTFDDGTSVLKGILSIRHNTNQAKWAIFAVSAVVDKSGYREISIDNVGASGASPFANGDPVTVGFVRTGDRGDQGGSYSYAFSSETGDADPGTGTLRCNAADLSAVTEIYIDDLDVGGTDVTPDILSWDDGTSAKKGSLILRGSPDTTDFVRYTITGLVDNAGYTTLLVEHITGSGTGFLSDGEAITVTFSRAGDQGDPGTSLRYAWDTGTSDADPGAGRLRADNADLTAATTLFIDDAELGGTDVAAQVATWDDSTSTVKGTITIRGKADPTDFVTYSLSALTDAAGYTKLTVAHVAGSATAPFADDDEVYISFVAKGDKGDTGQDGDVQGPESSADNALVLWDGTDGTTVKSSTSWSESSGALVGTSGNIEVRAATTENRSVQIGHSRSGDGTAFVDLVGDATYSDYGARLIREAGANANTILYHRGTGAMVLYGQEGGSFNLRTNATLRLSVSSAGAFDFQGNTATGAVAGHAEKTGSTYTTTAADVNGLVVMNSASPQTLTLHAAPNGTNIGIVQWGAGTVTIASGSGTLRAPNGAEISQQYGMVTAWRVKGDWVLGGDVA